MYGVKQLDIPKSLEEALEILAQTEGVLPLAGGTDILIKMRREKTRGAHLMALKDIKELFNLSEDSDGIHIGPMVTYSHLALNPIIEDKLPMVKTAALSMGGPQVQNLATIGGNICNGATSADGAAPLMALNAKLVLKSQSSTRELSITEFYTGPGKVVKRGDELLVDIIIPRLPNKGFAGVYEKFSTRKAMDIATLGCAATVTVDKDSRISHATLAYCTAGPTPVRCFAAEDRLLGESELNDDLMEEVADLALESTNPRTSWRATKEFRQNLIRELGKRALRTAYAQAGEHYEND